MQETSDIAVLVVDMQDTFLGKSKEKRALIPLHKELLRSCMKHEIPVIIVEYDGEAPTVSELQDELNKFRNSLVHTIKKTSNDAFAGTSLQLYLKHLGVKRLLIIGVNGDACVYTTSITAVSYGFEVIIFQDLIAGFEVSHPFYTQTCLWYLNNTTYFTDTNVLPLLLATKR